MPTRLEVIKTVIDIVYTPYIWGSNDPATGLDCSGMITWLVRKFKLNLNPDFDLTAQGWFDYYSHAEVSKGVPAGLVFYGGSRKNIVHVMLTLNHLACIGAVRGNKYIDTVEKARQKRAQVDFRPIDYRQDMVAMVDMFKGQP